MNEIELKAFRDVVATACYDRTALEAKVHEVRGDYAEACNSLQVAQEEIEHLKSAPSPPWLPWDANAVNVRTGRFLVPDSDGDWVGVRWHNGGLYYADYSGPYPFVPSHFMLVPRVKNGE